MRSHPQVLIVEDAAEVRQLLRRLVERAGMEPILAQDGQSALNHVRLRRPDVLLLDIRIPGLDGREVFQQVRSIDPHLPVIMITAYGSIPDAVRLVKAGAFEYLTKPFANDHVVEVICRAARERMQQIGSQPAIEASAGIPGLEVLMGRSAQVEELAAEVRQVAPTDFSVLIVGETGVGKELVAEAIHRQSRREGARFVAVDCGAIPETLIESELFGYEKGAFTGADRSRVGRFELAEGGTLFLDEISNLSPAMQNKLLRVLQERRFYRVGGVEPVRSNVRIIAASNQDLEAGNGSGPFRIDLYHRLSEYVIYVPSLRERREDIVYLAERFIQETNAELHKSVLGLSSEAIEALTGYRWVGNVRELRNVIRRGVLRATEYIELKHLGALGRKLKSSSDAPLEGQEEGAGAVHLSLKEIARSARASAERKVIRQLMEQTGGNIAEVARLLCADYKTIHTKIKEYGIQTRTLTSSALDDDSPSVGR